jgi:hypothetical protein
MVHWEDNLTVIWFMARVWPPWEEVKIPQQGYIEIH